VLSVLLSVVLLSLAAAPIGQFYLSWIGLAPLFIGIASAASTRRAMLYAWLGGVAYFSVNLWWLWTASTPGMVTLVLYYALFWALAAAIIRAIGLLTPLEPDASWRMIPRLFGLAAVWVGCEWMRCYMPSGFPWIPLGSTQTPIIVACQIADLGGPWIVSFWVVLPSALLALYWLNRNSAVWWSPALATVVAVLVFVFAYGIYRFATEETAPGPRVMVVQSNFPTLPGGTPTVEMPQAVAYFLAELEKNLAAEEVDLVLLPEAQFPPLNDEARAELAQAPVGPLLEETYQKLFAIAREHKTSLLIGGNAVTGWSTHGKEHVGSEIRNSAYFFDPGAIPPVVRYDKVELVRFSERAPITAGPEWLRRLAMGISANRATQPLFAGSRSEMRPFQLRWQIEGGHGTRVVSPFIAPICLENIDPAVMREMIGGSSEPYKKAQFVANISSDGWFATQEKYQHLQTLIMRCIENRVPMVRCSNTGISAYIDSSGQVNRQTLGPGQEGSAMWRIQFDPRQTFYTRYGDVFVYLCVVSLAVALAAKIAARFAGSRASNGGK
jgi:apolipoprotein N-acyltransferase